MAFEIDLLPVGSEKKSGDLLLSENAMTLLSESDNYSRILKNANNGKVCKVFTFLNSGSIFCNEDVLY